MKKKFNVVMLPTTKSNNIGDIVLNNAKELESNQVKLAQLNALTYNSDQPSTNQHLYLTSDDEIKDGRTNFYTHDPLNNKVCHVDYINYFGNENKGRGLVENGRASFRTFEGTSSGTKHKEIIATTDKSLESITINVDGHGNDLHQPLPQLSESFIQAYIKAYNEGNPITEVDLEMEQKDFKWVGEKNLADYHIKTNPDNTVIIHINQENNDRN